MNKLNESFTLFGAKRNYFMCPSSLCSQLSLNIKNDENIKFHKDTYRDNFKYVKNDIVDNKVTHSFHDAMKEIIDRRIKFISKYVDKNTDLLDVGAGAGTFTYVLKDKVKNVECLELDKRLVAEIKRLNMNSYSKPFEACDFSKTFTHVTMWHVFEHVLFGNEFLKKAHSILDKDGLLFVEVPINRAMRNERTKYDGHIHHYNEKSLPVIIENNNFSIIEKLHGLQNKSFLVVARKK